MVNVSQQFLEAMADPTTHPQRMFSVFDNGTIISNEDIDVAGGVDFHEVFCSETDLTIGLTPSSEISFGLFNDDGYYTDFTFGPFTAYLGVRLYMIAQIRPAQKRPPIDIDGNTANVGMGGRTDVFELCPLGRFIAPRPAVVQKVLIDVSANDQMTLFDGDLPSAAALGISYPVSAGNMLRALCGYVGVSAVSYDFLNSGLTMSEPESESVTMREVLGWIAEAACANARFNREGLLELAWFNTTARSFNEGNYAAFEPSWYQAPKVSKLHVRNSDSTEEAVIGSGDSAYMIQNNPFLRQDDTPAVLEEAVQP